MNKTKLSFVLLSQQDEDASHDSPISPPLNPLPSFPSSSFINPASYYSPYPFYNPMWSNLNYPAMSHANPMSYNLMNYHPGDMPTSFMFQDLSNYPRSNEFHGDI